MDEPSCSHLPQVNSSQRPVRSVLTSAFVNIFEMGKDMGHPWTFKTCFWSFSFSWAKVRLRCFLKKIVEKGRPALAGGETGNNSFQSWRQIQWYVSAHRVASTRTLTGFFVAMGCPFSSRAMMVTAVSSADDDSLAACTDSILASSSGSERQPVNTTLPPSARIVLAPTNLPLNK